MDIKQIRKDLDSGILVSMSTWYDLLNHAEQAGAVLAGRQQKIGEQAMTIAGLEYRISTLEQDCREWNAKCDKYSGCIRELEHALAIPSSQQAVAAPDRDAVLEEAAQICDGINTDCFDQYKGRGKHAKDNPHRADTHYDGMSNGAAACADAIRALKQAPQPIEEITRDGDVAECQTCGHTEIVTGCDSLGPQPIAAPSFDQSEFDEMVRKGTTAWSGSVDTCAAPACTRSHPHEDMDVYCIAKTDVARADNAASQQPVPAPPQSLTEIMDEVRRLGSTHTNKEILDSLGWNKEKPVPAPSIDSNEFDELLDNYSASDHSDYKQVRAALVAYINNWAKK